MTTAATKEKRKKKPGAKPLKKATEHDRRVKQAKAKTSLAVAAALVRGMLNEANNNLTFSRKKEREQAEKIKKWADECLYLNDMELGRRSLDEAVRATHRVHCQLNEYISGRGPHGIGDYAVAWLALGYIVDEAKHRYVGTPEHKRRWNYLASVVNTFAEMFLEQSEEDGTDYEAIAGEASEKVWASTFELPPGSWIKL